jgi:hypothetical protein
MLATKYEGFDFLIGLDLVFTRAGWRPRVCEGRSECSCWLILLDALTSTDVVQ